MLKRILSIILFMVLLTSCQEGASKKNTNKSIAKDSLVTKVTEKPKDLKFGLNLEDYEVHFDTVRRGDFFGGILDQHKVNPQMVYTITQQIPDTVFNSRKINVGKPYLILKDKDSLRTLGMIYENSKVEATKLFFDDSIYVEKHIKPIVEKKKIASGVITSSLSQAIDDAGINYRVTSKFADIYQWSVDFFKLQKGDQFKIIYNERFIDDTVSIGIGEIDAAILKHKDREFYAFNFLVDSTTGRYDYFDEKAKTLRSFFLKAPIQYSRISSRYTRKRFHPVQKRWKAHLGTDYAAPTGTPIWATADGVVTKSGYTRGNGNYVKLKHTNKYSTQYLHMSKRAVKVGEYVKQGELIGYVGATGLATGPHVCYRFWVNGKQVDPYKQDLPDAEPMEEEMKPSYFEFIQPIKEELDSLEYIKVDVEA